MNSWYMHPFTHVLIMGSAIPSGARYENTRDWHERGWCFFEGCASGLVKGAYCLWNEDSFEDATDLDGLRRQCKVGRQPPMSPPQFEQTLRARLANGTLAFTNGAVDADLVVDLYRTGFVKAFETMPQLSLIHNVISFVGLGFGSSPASVKLLSATLSYLRDSCSFAHGPVQIDASANGFSGADKRILRTAAQGLNHGVILHL
jgi:hypothetical protein